MNKFKLMQIVPSLNSGGVEQGTIDLANYIALNKISNSIISNGGVMLPLLNKKYVTHYKMAVHSKNFFKTPFLAKKINLIIEKNNINILHIRSRAPAWLLPFINKKNIITVSTFHNVYGHQNIFKKIYNRGLANTNYIIAISEYVSEEIIKHYKIKPEKVTVINRGIDTEFYNGKIHNEFFFLDFLKKNYIPSDKKIILFPGRITEWKGQIQFLNIVERLRNKEYQFFFAGDVKNTNYYLRLIYEIKKRNLQSNCRILGHLNKDDLKMMYFCSDLIISMPLKPEGFGRIISESLAMNKMLLAHNSGGVKNQLDKLSDIYKIKSRDDDELIQKINYILESDKNIFGDIKTKSRKFVINNFSKELMLKNYNSFYKDISN